MKGHVRPRGKGTWAIVLDLGPDPATGKRRQKWHSFKGAKRDAEKECARLITSISGNSYVEPSKVTVAKHLEDWLRDVMAPRLTPHSFERYSDMVRLYIIPHLGAVQLGKLTPPQIQECYAKLLRGGGENGAALTPVTVKGAHVILKAALKHAVRWDRLTRNPAEAVDAPRFDPPEIDALEEAPTMRIMEAARDTPLFMPILLAVTTGMRRGEILALRWKDLDLKAGTLSVRLALEESRQGLRTKAPKTKSGRRVIALPQLAIEELKRHKAAQGARQLKTGTRPADKGLVCDNGEGDFYRPVNMSMHFMRFIRKLDLPRVRFHDLRHGHASHLLRAGVQPKVVSARLGHSKIAITMDLYSHVLPGMQEDAAARLDGLLRQAQVDQVAATVAARKKTSG